MIRGIETSSSVLNEWPEQSRTQSPSNQESFIQTGELNIHLVGPEDICIFKSVAGRTDDVEDLFTLVQTDLGFDAVDVQIDAAEDELNELPDGLEAKRIIRRGRDEIEKVGEKP